MKTRTLLICSLFAMLSLVDAAYSQLLPPLPGTGFRWTPAKTLVPAGSGNAFIAKVKRDTTVAVHTDCGTFLVKNVP